MNYLLYAIIANVIVLFVLIIVLIIFLVRSRCSLSTSLKKRCPTCGQILELAWKRCPFCTDMEKKSTEPPQI